MQGVGCGKCDLLPHKTLQEDTRFIKLDILQYLIYILCIPTTYDVFKFELQYMMAAHISLTTIK